MKTRITEMFGIKYPVICGAMYLVGEPKLTAAVSNAGGMGNLTAGNYKTTDELRAAIRETKKLTDKPFMVGITILPSFHITMDDHRRNLEVCAEEKVGGIEVSGTPLDKVGTQYMDMLRKAGVKMFHKVGSVKHALHAEEAGYDGVYAAGIEEGGHPLNDDVTTMILTPKMAETVKIPVVTVGGIADGKSLAAALTLGAEGVMMATRFMATHECQVHENIKKEILKRQENDTTLICKTVNLQGRAIKNKIVAEILEAEKKGANIMELAPLITGERCLKAWQTGDVDIAPMMMGQSLGRINDIKSCKEVIEDMVAQAKKEIERVRGLF
ncbi:MAG TPA: nitronate monooxygenase [Spirochaetota bacterium]|nr:nitronate monooxygenase [Spirochaetota bacterium]HQO39178.1 nitronate monooxygenase [Spirochaetota bacterium]